MNSRHVWIYTHFYELCTQLTSIFFTERTIIVSFFCNYSMSLVNLMKSVRKREMRVQLSEQDIYATTWPSYLKQSKMFWTSHSNVVYKSLSIRQLPEWLHSAPPHHSRHPAPNICVSVNHSVLRTQVSPIGCSQNHRGRVLVKSPTFSDKDLWLSAEGKVQELLFYICCPASQLSSAETVFNHNYIVITISFSTQHN